MDPFVIYDDKYKKLKESVNDAMYGNQLEELYETTKVKYCITSLGTMPLYNPIPPHFHFL